ncbi:hypothetical protein NECAME_06873 [Necator americanus]|uniref:Uncharacterized protein n=1 Tax=Necator americanus TaxID=51031 RepID=W2TQZ0_NECAM|nr:hypothetical protein NECAME_06873 [Necator americanus]ETN84470.1 hypothetical protein NECAME_06873 [Necator americanus]
MEFVVNGPIPEDFMMNKGNRLSAFRYDKESNELSVLDQLLLPHRLDFIPVKNTMDAFNVRGAPLIAVVGALGLLVEMTGLDFKTPESLIKFLKIKVSI